MSSSLRPPPPPPPPQPAPVRLPRAIVGSSRVGVWIGVGLVVIGVVGGLGWGGLQLYLLDGEIDDLRRASVTDTLDFEVVEAVEWTLFAEPRDRSLSGVRYRVVSLDDSAEQPLAPYRSSFSYSTGSRSGRAVSTVRLEPGRYRLEVEGPLTIALGPSPAGRLAWLFVGAALVGAPLVIGGITLAIVTAIRDTRARTRAALAPPPSPWSAGEWPHERDS